MNKIAYVTFWINKFEECLRFYRDILELKIEYQDKNFVRFKVREVGLYLHRIIGKEKSLRQHSVVVDFETNDVDEAFQLLRKKGVKFEHEPENMPWGTRVAWFRDPEGYVLELVGPHKKGEPVAKH